MTPDIASASSEHAEYYAQRRAVNPFVHRGRLNAARKLQVALMTLTVVPVRCALIAVTLAAAWLFGALVTFGLDVKQPNKQPVGRLRARLFLILQLLCRALIFWMGVHWITVRGRRAKSRRAPIMIVSPHSSFMDIVVLMMNMPVPCPVSRVENARIPFLRTLCLAAQVLYVTREDTKSRRNIVQAIQERVQRPGAWPQLLIFPEGTTTNRRRLAQFKSGAFIPGVPVQPVTVEYLNAWDTYTWTGENDDQLLPLVWKTLCQFQTHIRVTYLPPYQPCDAERQDAALYADNLQALVAKQLQVPVSRYSTEDNRLMLQALASGLPVVAGAVEFGELRAKYSLGFAHAKQLLQSYAEVAAASRGLLNCEEFAERFDLAASEVTRALFGLYDRDGKGFMDFRDFLVGRMTRFKWTRETLTELFHRLSTDANLLSVDDLVRLKCPNVDQLFYSITTRPFTKVSCDDFVSKLEKSPERATFMEMLLDTAAAAIEDEAAQNVSI